MSDLSFKVNVDEANLILEGLGLLPFARVYALVEKLQLQAKEQLQARSPLAGGTAADETGGALAGGPSNGDLRGK